MNYIVCPICGSSATYIVIMGYTITVCTACYQARILEANVIVRIDRDKLLGQAAAQRELLAVALAMKSLYEHWDQIVDVSMTDR